MEPTGGGPAITPTLEDLEGGPLFKSMTTVCASALLRTALRTIPSWKLWIDQLEFAAKECLPFNQAFSGELSPAYWDCLSIAANLREAAGGVPSHLDWENGGRVIIQQLPTELNQIPLQRMAYNLLPSTRFGSNLRELS